MIGEAANSARAAKLSTETCTLENWLFRNGVNMPRTPRKSTAHTILPVERLRTTIVTAATDTMTQTAIL